MSIHYFETDALTRVLRGIFEFSEFRSILKFYNQRCRTRQGLSTCWNMNGSKVMPVAENEC
jgi:hypothetical protein